MKDRYIIIEGNELYHHGVKGQKWGKRQWQTYDGSLTPAGRIHYGIKGRDAQYEKVNQISDLMKTIHYKEFDRLMSPLEVKNRKEGSCHDQVMLEMSELKKLGLKPKALFMMEHSEQQGGMTHSLVYFEKDNKVYWVENAWEERAGIHAFNSIDEIKNEIRSAHKTGEYGDISVYNDLSFGDFNHDNQKIGETLQELVDNIIWDD